jgi:hypothetical protein
MVYDHHQAPGGLIGIWLVWALLLMPAIQHSNE